MAGEGGKGKRKKRLKELLQWLSPDRERGGSRGRAGSEGVSSPSSSSDGDVRPRSGPPPQPAKEEERGRPSSLHDVSRSSDGLRSRDTSRSRDTPLSRGNSRTGRAPERADVKTRQVTGRSGSRTRQDSQTPDVKARAVASRSDSRTRQDSQSRAGRSDSRTRPDSQTRRPDSLTRAGRAVNTSGKINRTPPPGGRLCHQATAVYGGSARASLAPAEGLSVLREERRSGRTTPVSRDRSREPRGVREVVGDVASMSLATPPAGNRRGRDSTVAELEFSTDTPLCPEDLPPGPVPSCAPTPVAPAPAMRPAPLTSVGGLGMDSGTISDAELLSTLVDVLAEAAAAEPEPRSPLESPPRVGPSPGSISDSPDGVLSEADASAGAVEDPNTPGGGNIWDRLYSGGITSIVEKRKQLVTNEVRRKEEEEKELSKVCTFRPNTSARAEAQQSLKEDPDRIFRVLHQDAKAKGRRRNELQDRHALQDRDLNRQASTPRRSGKDPSGWEVNFFERLYNEAADIRQKQKDRQDEELRNTPRRSVKPVTQESQAAFFKRQQESRDRSESGRGTVELGHLKLLFNAAARRMGDPRGERRMEELGAALQRDSKVQRLLEMPMQTWGKLLPRTDIGGVVEALERGGDGLMEWEGLEDLVERFTVRDEECTHHPRTTFHAHRNRTPNRSGTPKRLTQAEVQRTVARLSTSSTPPASPRTPHKRSGTPPNRSRRSSTPRSLPGRAAASPGRAAASPSRPPRAPTNRAASPTTRGVSPAGSTQPKKPQCDAAESDSSSFVSAAEPTASLGEEESPPRVPSGAAPELTRAEPQVQCPPAGAPGTLAQAAPLVLPPAPQVSRPLQPLPLHIVPPSVGVEGSARIEVPPASAPSRVASPSGAGMRGNALLTKGILLAGGRGRGLANSVSNAATGGRGTRLASPSPGSLSSSLIQVARVPSVGRGVAAPAAPPPTSAPVAPPQTSAPVAPPPTSTPVTPGRKHPITGSTVMVKAPPPPPPNATTKA
eukprot:Hpha_TRINITY_DN4009_c0_g1::TRINITY_DN4009_c0_g1_i1::g.63800::m.63800